MLRLTSSLFADTIELRDLGNGVRVYGSVEILRNLEQRQDTVMVIIINFLGISEF